jgi:hypothetical protein
MSSIEDIITEAVTTDRSQIVLSVGAFPDAFDACLERVLQRQLELDAQGVVRSWLRTQLHPIIRTPKANPIGVFYGQLMRKAGPQTLAGLDFLSRQHWNSSDPVVQALIKLSQTFISQKDYTERVHQEQLLFTYLLGDSEPSALAELGFSQNLSDIDDKLFVLGIVLRCLIGVKAKIGTNGEVGPASRLYLVLDEIENVLALSNETCWAFTHWLEHLCTDVGEGLTLWMDIKTKDEITIKRVQSRLGRRWITHTLYCTS